MTLTSAERRLVSLVFDGLMPPGNSRLGLGASQAGVVEFFERQLGYLPLKNRVGLRAAVDLAGAYAKAHPRGARAALEGLAASRFYVLREVVTLLKSVLCMGYFMDPRVRAELGLDLTLVESRS